MGTALGREARALQSDLGSKTSYSTVPITAWAKGLADPVLSNATRTLASLSWPSVLCVALLSCQCFWKPENPQLASPWGSSKPLVFSGPSSSQMLMRQAWLTSLPQYRANAPRTTWRKWE